MNDFIFNFLRSIHILAGFTALFAGPVAMVTHKGGRKHRLSGKIYFWGMAIVAATALGMSILRTNHFLLLIAIFSFYFSLTGYRALYQKKRTAGNGSRWDRDLAVVMLLASAVMMIYGIINFAQLGVVMIVFGGIGAVLGVQDLRKWMTLQPSKYQWFYDHIARMGASYIATLSAFSVVNFTFIPDVIRWLWATAFGTPLIIYTVRQYRARFEAGKKPDDVATFSIKGE
ncbi:MAG: DUF2306 domain-containing protein [Chloroherpetonaceae bacterium]|nr:DUF2306 domain-containing protein [Chloroherpetonaceae bacterium]